MAFETGAMLTLVFATQGWVLFAMAPVFALGGIGMPALQSLSTQQEEAGRQGQLQGVLASLVSRGSVFGPLFFSFVYNGFRPSWPGAIWLVAMSIYLLALPLMAGIRRADPEASTEPA